MPPPEGTRSRALRLLGPLFAEAGMQLVAHWRLHRLTLVGIVWGAASVVLLLSVGSGFNAFLDLGIEKTGDRWVQAVGRYTTTETNGARLGRRISLERRDLERLRAGVPSASAVAGEVLGGALVKTPKRTRSTIVSAGGPEMKRIRNHRIRVGRFYDEADEALGRRVAVVGARLAETLFESEAVGRTLQINGVAFEVVGELHEKGMQLMTNMDLHDRMAFIPLSTGQRLAGFGRGDGVDHVLLLPRRRDDEAAVEAELRDVLWPLHHLDPAEDAAIELSSVSRIIGPHQLIGKALQVLLGFIGTVTLAMAAIGVANLMLAIVAERQRELAMRRACGARRADLVLQLLVETVAVVLAAGCLGVLLGVGVIEALRAAPLPAAMPQPYVAPSVVATTFLVLTAVGLLAGVVPARTASRVDPGAALRAS